MFWKMPKRNMFSVWNSIDFKEFREHNDQKDSEFIGIGITLHGKIGAKKKSKIVINVLIPEIRKTFLNFIVFIRIYSLKRFWLLKSRSSIK